METILSISTEGTKSTMLRYVLILTGIVIAIVCSLVSLKDVDNQPAEASAQASTISQGVVSTNLLIKAASTIGHSVIVYTKE